MPASAFLGPGGHDCRGRLRCDCCNISGSLGGRDRSAAKARGGGGGGKGGHGGRELVHHQGQVRRWTAGLVVAGCHDDDVGVVVSVPLFLLGHHRSTLFICLLRRERERERDHHTTTSCHSPLLLGGVK